MEALLIVKSKSEKREACVQARQPHTAAKRDSIGYFRLRRGVLNWVIGTGWYRKV